MATFTNRASLSFNGNTLNSNLVTGEILEVLSAEKTSAPAVYRRGDTVTYVINIVNTGAAPFNALTVTDNLGAYDYNGTTLVPLDYVPDSVRYFVNGAEQAAPAVTGTNPLTVTGLTVPAGGNAAVVYQATANDFAPPVTGSTVTNTASVTGAGLTSPVTAESQITASDAADLAISKSVSPATVSENGTLTYTFEIQNYGNTPVTAAENAVVSDTFNPILDPINVSFNNTAWTENTNYTYNRATGEFATAPNQLEVGAATYNQDPVTGQYTVTPGTATIVVSGTV